MLAFLIALVHGETIRPW